MPAETRDRIVEATSELFRRQGYVGTGLKQIAAAAGAPFGSIYHFFPGGKEELAETVIRSSGRHYQDLVASVLLEVDDPVLAVRHLFARAAEDLEASDFADACPVATIALEVASTNEALRRVTDDVFTGWLEAAAAYFRLKGVDAERAPVLARQYLALLEGAFVVCRATRTTDALLSAGAAMEMLVREALGRGED